MPFRIAIGSMSCEDINKSDKIGYKIKEIIEAKINIYKNNDFKTLLAMSEYRQLDYEFEKKIIEVSFFKEQLDSENLLLVVRAAYRTFNMPTYISWGFVGKVYAAGIVVNDKNVVSTPNEELLWDFK